MSNMIAPSSMDVIRDEIYESLNEIGVPQHLAGYKYLAYGIEYLLDHFDDNISITKELYPAIAKYCDTAPQRVERSIRHAIMEAFEIANYDALYKYFGNAIKGSKCLITNNQFMQGVVYYLYRDLRTR